MGQRTLSVDGREYRYSIGRTHVKIVGPDGSTTLPKSEVGNRLDRSETFVVTPRNVANVVRGLPGPKKFVCEHHGEVTTEVAIDPFDYEIHGKKAVVAACRQCLENRARDI
ncbi:hypothetical protein [Rhizobium leguminosarum]|uniref:hypothetical protein n=1 Tax=Rhizobium leguminosarum TaxID=384 RepID=UPI002E165772|nr:hypothetical protein U8Q02_40540 [Rhizobium leguminosarum]